MRRLSFMVTILIGFILVNIKVSEAQRTFPANTKPNPRMDGPGFCWKSSPLGLTRTQTKVLESIQRTYLSEVIPLRTQIISLRIELRHITRDPEGKLEILLDHQKRISELQTKLDNISLSYLIKARSIFTKEQLKQLPDDCLMGIEPRFGMGVSREPRKGLLK